MGRDGPARVIAGHCEPSGHVVDVFYSWDRYFVLTYSGLSAVSSRCSSGRGGGLLPDALLYRPTALPNAAPPGLRLAAALRRPPRHITSPCVCKSALRKATHLSRMLPLTSV
jgi:hypothetical protein